MNLENPESDKLINKHLPQLGDRLEPAGLKANFLGQHVGEQAAPDFMPLARGAEDASMTAGAEQHRQAIALLNEQPGLTRVTARGDDELARQIIDLARERDVPVREEPGQVVPGIGFTVPCSVA